jgi:phospholipase/carboxylesterase
LTVPETLLETVEVTTGPRPELAVIWLHGLGADGHDFEPIVPELALDFAARFVFPHAPVQAVTINGGMRMRAWYDILGWDAAAPEDGDGIRASAAQVTRLIEREIGRGIDTPRIALAGFSQGGAIALHTALRETRPLGGAVGLSTYLPLADTLPAERSEANASLPVLMAHGTTDPVIPLESAVASRRLLERLGYRVEWHSYPMGHGVCGAEIAAIGAWLSRLAAR